MRYPLIFAALLAVGCSSSDDTPAGIDLQAMDQSVDPCTDFYQFACGNWIATHPVGSDGVVAAKFHEPYYEALPRLRDIVEQDAAGARAADDPHADLIGNYFASCNDAPGNLDARSTLRALLDNIDKLSTLDDVARQTAIQRGIGSVTLFSFYVGVDPGDATRSTVRIDQGGFELDDRSYYLDPNNGDLMARYRTHIETMSGLIGGTPIDAAAAIRVEKAIAEASLPRDERRDPESLHHPMKLGQVIALAPTFPWATYLQEEGMSDLDDVDVAVPEYLTALDAILKSTPIEDLKSYLRWQLLQDLAAGLDQAFLDEDFAFWSEFTGQSALSPRWFTCLNATLDALGYAVAEPYAARFYDEETTQATSAMFDRARGAFAKRIETAAWLDEATRTEALAKLDVIVAKIGHPAQGPDLAGLTLTSGSYLDNRLSLRRFSVARNKGRLGQPVDRSTWNLSPVTVNAIYTWSANDLTLPAALLTSPFFVGGRTDAANFGALGAIIGHEMTHGFDDQGRHYDGNGSLRNWWTLSVETRFVERVQCVEQQFDAFTLPSGEHVNGTLTLGENLADLGGIRTAHGALFDGSNEESGGNGFDAAQVFFISYAQTWCENVRSDYASLLLLTDPHAPGRFRVNGPLSNMSEFREAFECSADAPMVRAKPCEVW
ncbi:Metallopeptidase [Minicystis rosea]|nr:Metallopeptidase [Minicystis rosea]